MARSPSAVLREELVIDPARTALLTVDMHRGHLDPEIATQPVSAEESARVVKGTARALEVVRAHGIPVIHIVLTVRPVEAERARLLETNLIGSPGTELMPELGPAPTDHLIDTKKTLNSFYGTDLDNLLRTLDTQTVLICGVNTNTCVLCTAFEASNRRYSPVVLSDCVASMYGADLHEFALENIRRTFGWVLSVDELDHTLAGRGAFATT
jgi:nicotinamidase-related amidase